MRTIGTKNIKLVKMLAKEEMKKANGLGSPNYSAVEDTVLERLPENIFDTWEGAQIQIENIIQDIIMKTEV